MTLILQVTKTPAGVTPTESERMFNDAGASIGRGDSNDWILMDPDRYLSSRHCAISCEGGQYYLTDTSTNGTFLNGSPEPIGKGGKAPLNDGDSIEVGDYQFRVQLSQAAGAPAIDDPFADLEPTAAHGAPPTQAPVDDPFSAPPPTGDADPFGTSSPFDDSFSLGPDPKDADPLAALDKAGQMGDPGDEDPFSNNNTTADPLGLGGSAPESLEDDSLFGLSSNSKAASTPTQDPFSGPTYGEAGNAMQQSVDWPESKSESVIPENWDDDLLGGDDTGMTDPAPADPLDPRNAPRSLPLTDPPSARPARNEEPLLAERPPERVEAFGGGREQAVDRGRSAPPPEPRRDAPPARAPEVRPPPARAESAKPENRAKVAQAAGDALLAGLGLTNKNLGDDDIAELHQLIGELLPVIITGMMQVLRSRASIKNEFRMNVTTIQPIENNPLKFSADAFEAIDNMFVRRSSAYMGPKEAFREGFDSIGEHQVAIIAGIRAAFKSMMDRFNPEKLETQFDRQNKGVGIPGMQKARYWSSYSDYYRGFVDNMENSFQYLFGDEFVEAYEEQLRRLSIERKQRQP